MIITGVGGQGNVLASQIIGQILIQKGYIITIGETYGVSQRGGSVMSHLRISRRAQFSPLIPEGKCDFVLGLEPAEALRVLGHCGNPEVLMLVNVRPIFPIDVISGDATYPQVDLILERIKGLCRKLQTVNATGIALEIGNPILSNIVMLGALSVLDILPMDRDEFHRVIEEVLPAARLTANLEAFDRGRSALRESAL